jgi:hypothetical protein
MKNIPDPGNQRGMALVLSMFLMMTMSVMAASMMFLSQTETYSTMNYRMMSQARYAAESGIHRAVNHLLDPAAYTPPGGAGDPIANYDTTVSPVTFNGAPVVLSANASVPSNYPIAAVKTAFDAAVKGSVAVANATASYAPYATLLSMEQVNTFGGASSTVQVWQITSTGSITGARTATVEVTAVLETQKVAGTSYGYAAFATSGVCGALKWSGGAITDSYDSQALVGGLPVIDAWGGNVGTNGNLTESGGATIKGTLSTPRVGVGNCSNGNVNGLTSSGGATVTGGIIQLPQEVTLPAPPVPNPLPPTGNVNISGGANVTYAPGTYADIKLSGGSTLHFTAGTYIVNSISLSGGSTLIIDSGPVILQVAGTGATNPIDFSGGTISNATYNPLNFQVNYAGTGGVKLSGGVQSSAMVYAPNAEASFSGGADFYGSVIAKTVTDTGGAKVHYDRRLSSTNTFWQVGNPMLTSFSWKKY